tara:strand:+ start:491 stop:691 length:201 start_codon:yes stop_codon:yes gene_type:complete
MPSRHKRDGESTKIPKQKGTLSEFVRVYTKQPVLFSLKLRFGQPGGLRLGNERVWWAVTLKFSEFL